MRESVRAAFTVARVSASAVLLVVAIAACGTDRSAAAAGTFDADALPPLALREELRIGSVEDAAIGFSRIVGIAVADDGSVFVLEGQDRHVRVYDAGGRLQRVIGRQGSGPGELEAPTRFGLIGDTLWVYDLRNQRITLFRATGELIATVPTTGVTVPVETPGVTARVVPHEPRADGRFSSRLAVSMAGGAELTDTFSVAALVFDATGAVVDSAGRHVHTPRPPGGVTVGGLTLAVQNPLLDTPLQYAHGGDSVRIDRTVATSAAASAFVVTRRDASGDTVFSHRFRYLPRPVDAGFADAQVAPIMEMVAQFPVDQAAVETAVRGALSLPDWHPPVSSYRSGADGSLWLRREDSGGDDWRWIVLRPDGMPRGELGLPRSATVQWVSGDDAWVVVRDEFDVPWLVRYRIG